MKKLLFILVVFLLVLLSCKIEDNIGERVFIEIKSIGPVMLDWEIGFQSGQIFVYGNKNIQFTIDNLTLDYSFRAYKYYKRFDNDGNTLLDYPYNNEPLILKLWVYELEYLGSGRSIDIGKRFIASDCTMSENYSSDPTIFAFVGIN